MPLNLISSVFFNPFQSVLIVGILLHDQLWPGFETLDWLVSLSTAALHLQTRHVSVFVCVYVCVSFISVSMCVPATACVSVCVCLGMSVCVCHPNTLWYKRYRHFHFYFLLLFIGGARQHMSGDLTEVTATEHKNRDTDVSKVCLCVRFFFKCPPMTIVTDRWHPLQATTTLSERTHTWRCVLSLSHIADTWWVISNNLQLLCLSVHLSFSIHHWPSVAQHIFHSDLQRQLPAPRCAFLDH